MKNKKKTVTIIAIIGIGLAIIGGIGFYTCYHTWNEKLESKKLLYNYEYNRIKNLEMAIS